MLKLKDIELIKIFALTENIKGAKQQLSRFREENNRGKTQQRENGAALST